MPHWLRIYQSLYPDRPEESKLTRLEIEGSQSIKSGAQISMLLFRSHLIISLVTTFLKDYYKDGWTRPKSPRKERSFQCLCYGRTLRSNTSLPDSQPGPSSVQSERLSRSHGSFNINNPVPKKYGSKPRRKAGKRRSISSKTRKSEIRLAK